MLLIGPLFSLAIDFAQQTFLPARYATASDVLANSLGTLIGAAFAVILRLLVAWRDRYIVERALADRESRLARIEQPGAGSVP